MELSPQQFGLTSRTVLEQIDESTIAIVIDRKSRIIMADGKRIVQNVKKIQQHKPGTTIVVKTDTPICSKTVTFLKNEGIDLLK